MTETYLGDGLYASDDGYQFTLRAGREDTDHWVCLDSSTLQAFFDYVAKQRGCTIVINPETENAAC